MPKPKRLKQASHDDRLSLVEHLDELRTRLIRAIGVLALTTSLCFWQNDFLLGIANGPLPDKMIPVTFGVTEPFVTTLTLSFYGGLLLAMPFLLFQLFAYILPAFSPYEKKAILPFLIMTPFLFTVGAVFAYFVVLPNAINFLLNFNAEDFLIQVRAREYYSFFALTLVSVGLLFQIPIAILALCRLEIITPEWLAENRRYAILVIAVLAMLLPGTDPITMIISMLPLVLLFEASLILARIFDPRKKEKEGSKKV